MSNIIIQKDYMVLDGGKHLLKEVEYFDECYTDGNIFGSAIAKSLKFSFYNKNLDLENKTIDYITSKNGKETEMGSFIIADVKEKGTNGYTEAIGFDFMTKFDVPYISKLKYETGKVILKDVLKEACRIAEVELGTFHFANATKVITENPFVENNTCRDVIKAIAALAGRFAKIGKNNKLYLKSLKNSGPQYTIKTSEYFEITKKRNTHAINTVIIGYADIEGENTVKKLPNVTEENTNKIEILNNPFCYSQEKRELFIDELFDELVGFSYQSFEIKAQGNENYNTGDRIKLMNPDGGYIYSYILRYSFKSPVLLDSEYSAPSLIKSVIKYEAPNNLKEQIKHTEIKVDKALSEITAEIKNLDEKGTLQVSKLEQLLNSIVTTVQEERKDREKEFTKLKQDFKQFVYEIQTTGKDNLIFDSAFYSFSDYKSFEDYKNKDGKDFYKWYGELANDDNHLIQGQVVNDSVSGYGIKLYNNILYQKLKLKNNELSNPTYSLGFKFKKNLVGTFSIRIKNSRGEEVLKYEMEAGESTNNDFKKKVIEDIAIPKGDYILIIKSSNDAKVELTDLILNIGSKSSQWNQAIGEVRNTSASIGQEGLLVQGKDTNDLTKISTSEVISYNFKNGSREIAFKISAGHSFIKDLEIAEQLEINPFKFISVDDGIKKGLAIVKN